MIHLFPTGQGNVVGHPVEPVIKITANPLTAATMSEHIDVDVSGLLQLEYDLAEAGDRLEDVIDRTVNGRLTCAEALGHREFALTRLYPARRSQHARSARHRGQPAGRDKPGSPAVGWRWMGSNEPLFLRVAEQIERFVAGNGLAPGDRLPGERELCELLGVSRASVREALRSLETRGVVRVRHGKGVFVAAPDEGERALQRFSRLREVGLEELFAMREVLEVPAAGWAAAEASEEQLASLITTFEQHEQAVRAQAGQGSCGSWTPGCTCRSPSTRTTGS